MLRNRIPAIGFHVAALWLLSSCANQAATSPTPSQAPPPAQALVASLEPTTVTVVMGDHYFQPATFTLKAGQPVRLEMQNKG